MSKLRASQQRFVDEYLIDLNATQAYIRAGYAAKGNSAEVNASKLLRNTKVAAAIEIAKKKRSERTNITADDVLKSLVEIKEMDVADILDETGELKMVSQWPKVWRTMISGIDIATMGSGESEAILKKIKWPDKVKNLELIGKHVEVQAWLDRQEKKHVHEYENMSNDELRDRLTKLRQQNEHTTH